MEKSSKSIDKIDFVILWVDGNDPEWINEKNMHSHRGGDQQENRFRDCENLHYLFRSIEKYANWVNNIFFVTWGHIPPWLNTKNKKIKIVRHEDFIPNEYLPTFNSNVIELNLHRIKDLSEHFVLLNDDLFLLKDTNPSDFFINNLPTDVYVENIQVASFYNDIHFFMKANILAIINKYFNKKELIKKNFFKMINYKYGKFNFRTLKYLSIKKKFCGFWNFHAPQPYLKKTFLEVWEKEGENLDLACHNKFRQSTDLGHYLCRYWQMVSGKFIPKKDETKYFVYNNNNDDLISALKTHKYKMICINDAYVNIDFHKVKNEINQVFAEILPDKSEFET
ncbi:MAG: stealth family protein [Clostridia bacterium]|nr:stealth family protein [Clostridia bacterium]